LGATEKHCETCAGLAGVVATAKDWEELFAQGIEPQGDKLMCGGWQCDCEIVITDEPLTKGGIPDVAHKSLKHYPGGQDHDQQSHAGTGGGVDLSKTKIVDKNGAPLVMYHGTGKEFDTFDVSERTQTGGTIRLAGAWFTSDKEMARQYARKRGDNPRIINAYLGIENPFVITLRETSDYREKVDVINESYITDLQQKGYDGIVINYDLSGPYGMQKEMAEVVVFKPEQVQVKEKESITK
jgi:hypothetical protein